MLRITDPGIPNGLTQNLAGLVQALIEKPQHDQAAKMKQQALDDDSAYKKGTLAEQIRAHDLMDEYHDTQGELGHDRVANSRTAIAEKGRHNGVVEGQGATRNDIAQQNADTAESRVGDPEDKNYNEDLKVAQHIHGAWLGSQLRSPTPAQEAAHFNATLEGVRSHRASGAGQAPAAPQPAAPVRPAVGGGQGPVGQNEIDAMRAGRPAQPPAGAPLQVAQPPPSSKQVQLLNKAQSWLGLPMIVDRPASKARIEKALAAKDFATLEAMEAKMAALATGSVAR